MIISICYCGFLFYYKDNDNKYKEIFDEILVYNFKIVKVLCNIDDIKVFLIDMKYGCYVFKVFVLKMKRNECFLKFFVKGDYYQNLIVEIDCVRSVGFIFFNDFYFLVECKIFNYVSVFIMFIEYVEGVEFNDMLIILENIKVEIKVLMEKLYVLNMLLGDLYWGNFIVSKDGVRIIDLFGKSCMVECKVCDCLVMECYLGIVNEIKDYGYYLVIYRIKLCKFIKKLKGKV